MFLSSVTYREDRIEILGNDMETMLNRWAFLESMWSSGVTFIADNRVTRHVLPPRMRRSN